MIDINQVKKIFIKNLMKKGEGKKVGECYIEDGGGSGKGEESGRGGKRDKSQC